MADHRRLQPSLPILAHMEKRRTLGRANPLVQVGGIVSRAQLPQIQRQHAGRMGAVHQSIHAARFERPGNLPHGHHQRRIARNMINQCQPRLWRYDPKDGLGNLICGLERKGNVGHHQFCARFPGDFHQHIPTGIVIEARRQEFITPP